MTNYANAVDFNGTFPNTGELISDAGSYSDPAWLTSLSGSKVTGGVPGSGTSLVITTGASATLTPNAGNYANRVGTVTYALPATCALNEIFIVGGIDATAGSKWVITVASGQTIIVGAGRTDIGAGGSITAAFQTDNLRFRCIVANTTFVAESVIGSLTVV
jgi:hypothetical protein